MRRFGLMLCLVLNISVLLMPFSTLHVHVTSDQHHPAGVHGGHSHDFEHGHDAGNHVPADADRVLDLKPVLANKSSALSNLWMYGVPLACVIAVITLATQLCIRLLRPPEAVPRPLSRHGCRWPPLRGPPSISIQAL